MVEAYGLVEVDLFPEEVDSLDHPDVTRFKRLLEEVAQEYHCRLLNLDIDAGTVIFSFDSHELMADILKILQNDRQGKQA